MRRLVNKLVIMVGFAGLTISPLNGNAQSSAGAILRQTACDLEQHTAVRGEESCNDFAPSNGFPMLASASAQPFFGDDQPTVPAMKLATGYKLTKKFAVPGEGGWDYIAVDGDARRVYVSHGDQIQVLNADSGKLLGQIPAPGAHGVALAPELHRGFTSNGKDKSVTIFDSGTLAVIKTVKLEGGTDAIVYDPATKRVFPMSEKITVVDAQTGYRRTQGEYHPLVLSPPSVNDPIHRVHQYSSGKSSVVEDRSASVMIHSFSPAFVW